TSVIQFKYLWNRDMNMLDICLTNTNGARQHGGHHTGYAVATGCEAAASSVSTARSSASCLAPRTAMATLINVGFMVVAVGISALPPTTRLACSHTREYGSATLVPSLRSPMRMVPW